MIDLHIHTNYSDGSYTVKEILQEAQKRKLEVISITDHDCIEAYDELAKLNVKQYYSGTIIKGCEMKCVYKNTPIEILGYNLNIEKFKKSKNLGDLKNKYLKIQNTYLEHLKKVGKEIGLKFNKNLKVDVDKMQYASDRFQNEIMKYKENIEILNKKDIKLEPNFYRAQQCNPHSIFYINETMAFPKVEDLIEEIQEVDGFAFLAHAYIYPFNNTLEIVEEMIKTQKLDGIECYYSYFEDYQRQSLEELCKKYNLYISGGSDFHGKNRPDTKMGIGTGNLKIEESVIKNWIKKCKNVM